MTRDEIDRIKALCEAATVRADNASGIALAKLLASQVAVIYDVPTLIAEVERLQAELGEANAMLDFMAKNGARVFRAQGDNVDGTPNPTAWCVLWVTGDIFQAKIHEHYGTTPRAAIKAAMEKKS